MLTVFSVAIAPYRIDFFNSIAQMGKSSFYFTQQGVDGSSFDDEKMRHDCRFEPKLLKSVAVLGRKLPLSVWRILRQERPSTVFAPEFSLVTLLVLLYKFFFFASFKVISICDDSIDMLNGNDFSRLHGYARKLMAPLCDELLLLDSKATEWYQRQYGKGIWFPLIRDDEKYATLLADAEPAEQEIRIRYPEINNTKVVLFVGRLVALKNVAAIIKALPKDAFLVIVGDGEERKSLESLVVTMGKNVLFVGWKNGGELLAWYRIAHVLVLASFREPFGAVVNEALLAGCRVCVSDRAGSACLVSPDNGCVFNPEDENELSLKLKQEIENQPLRKIVKSLMPVSYADFVKTLQGRL